VTQSEVGCKYEYVVLKLARDDFHRRVLGKVTASCPGENINWLEAQRQFTLFL
jgi:hypothetical protein